MRSSLTYLFLIFLLLLFFILDIVFGSVQIPFSDLKDVLLMHKNVSPQWSYIIWQMRIPAAVTAVITGAGLSVCGLQMQTLFRNPLADASILGISGGASLGVALFMMGGTLLGNLITIPEFLRIGGMILFAILGAALVLLLIASLSFSSRDITQVLIVGVMISFLAGAIISLLQYFSPPELVKGFQVWSFGSLEGSTTISTLILACIVLPAVIICLFFIKPLNALLLGESYARSLGISTKFVRRSLIILTGIIAGTLTAFVGPIAFIGIAVPHIVRGLSATRNHKHLLPLSLLGGATLMLICHLITRLPQGGLILPINVVTSVIGAPIVLGVVISGSSRRIL